MPRSSMLTTRGPGLLGRFLIGLMLTIGQMFTGKPKLKVR